MDDAGIDSRAGELSLTPEELAAWRPRLSAGVAAALLSSLIRYEDALLDLAGTAAEGERG